MLAHIMENYNRYPIHVVFADTGWEHSDAIQWSESIVNRYGLKLHVVRNPNKDFFQMVRNRGKFPSPAQRQCTSDLKRNPIQTWIRRNCQSALIVNCMGLRSEESPARAKRLVLTRDRTMTNSRRTVWNWLPIHGWSETQVRSYLAELDIPLHPVYDYLNRFSCQVCIYMSKRDLRAVQMHNPVAFNRIAELEREIGFTMQPGHTLAEGV